MPTVADYRRHYEDFTTSILRLCTDPGVRRDLKDGRGRPVNECIRMHRYLTVRTAGHGQLRAHYTTASLIALVDPLQEARTRPYPPAAPGQASATGGTGEASAAPPPGAGPPSPTTTPPPPVAAPPTAHTPAGPGELDRYTAALWRRRPNLGTTLARAVRRGGFNEDRTDNLLHVLVAVGDDHLHQYLLPSLTDRLLACGLELDWPVLLDDLAARTFDADEVGTRWLDAFYLTLTPPTNGRS
jgi:hypothetical protein